MKKNKLVKNVISILLFVIMLILFAYLGTKDYTKEVADNVRFATEYPEVSKNNIYKYTKEHEILNILNGGNGIVFMGFPSNTWSRYYALYLNEAAQINQVSKIYYYDFKKDRDINSKTYLNIVEKLKEYLYVTDLDTIDLSAPTILIVKNGEIIYFNNEVSQMKANITPEEYFNEYHKNVFMNEIDTYLKTYMGKEVQS